MNIRPVQFNINTKSKEEYKHYLEADGAINTTGLVKPLPGQGHLIHDNLLTGPKYFVKDYAYDMKSLKNGIKGTANDHQLGRLNDVGLQLGGVGIATYLASKTTNPKARIMEYAGLAAFLTAMNVYPKIAINKPAEIFHGHDIDKWYIDDQGRKKSVNQDSNYVPYDLYRAEAKGEDLDEIGDRMGIPRDIKNRHAIIKEQMRKISTQSNTLWMLTAGLATPVMTALACYGLENYVISPELEKIRNNKYNKFITETLDKTKNMEISASELPENDLSVKINKIISKYKGHELPKDEFKRIMEVLTENLDEKTAEGIREDFPKLLDEVVLINGEIAEEMNNSGKKLISKSKKEVYEKILIPTREELEAAIKTVVTDADFVNGTSTNPEKLQEIKSAIRKLIDSKIENAPQNINKKHLAKQRDNILGSMIKTLEGNKTKAVTENSIEKAVNFAKILGEFKENQKILDKCKSFKFEFAPETVLARSYGKFEKAVIKELGITANEMKMMRESDEYTLELLNKKISELCQNEEKFKKTFEKLGKIMSEMEVNLHGASEDSSHILDLINAIENNYNNTAKRLSNLGGFDRTITKLVNEDVATLGNSITSRQGIFDFLDGIIEYTPGSFIDVNNHDELNRLGIDKNEALRRNHENAQIVAKKNSKGIGSSKYADLTRTIERYQGVKNSFNRVLHTLDVFKRTTNTEDFIKQLHTLDHTNAHISRKDLDYVQTIIKNMRNTVLTATSSDHNLKLNLVNNNIFYRDFINALYMPAANENLNSIKAKGFLSDILKGVLGNDIQTGNIEERLQTYITKCRNIFGNGDIDFTKENHRIWPNITRSYAPENRTRMAFFNLVGQTPVNFAKGASKRQYGTKKWFQIISGVTAGVFATTILAQAGFGKIRNPHNIQKQVKDETN